MCGKKKGGEEGRETESETRERKRKKILWVRTCVCRHVVWRKRERKRETEERERERKAYKKSDICPVIITIST